MSFFETFRHNQELYQVLYFFGNLFILMTWLNIAIFLSDWVKLVMGLNVTTMIFVHNFAKNIHKFTLIPQVTK